MECRRPHSQRPVVSPPPRAWVSLHTPDSTPLGSCTRPQAGSPSPARSLLPGSEVPLPPGPGSPSPGRGSPSRRGQGLPWSGRRDALCQLGPPTGFAPPPQDPDLPRSHPGRSAARGPTPQVDQPPCPAVPPSRRNRLLQHYKNPAVAGRAHAGGVAGRGTRTVSRPPPTHAHGHMYAHSCPDRLALRRPSGRSRVITRVSHAPCPGAWSRC